MTKDVTAIISLNVSLFMAPKSILNPNVPEFRLVTIEYAYRQNFPFKH